MRIEGDGDDSPIIDMITIGDALYIVKECGIYTFQLADQIDPERTNAAIPDALQRVLAIGASDPIVARTLLTADTLFQQRVLGPSFDEGKGLKLVWELLQDFVTMSDMGADLKAAEGAGAHFV
jgi:hypothetical protein